MHLWLHAGVFTFTKGGRVARQAHRRKRERDMRDLLRNYFDGHLSRRGFIQCLIATGLTSGAARSIAEAADLGDLEAEQEASESSYAQTGSGGDLLLEQVKAAGTKFIFTNPGSLESAFFDALTDRPELQVIVGLHEGIVISMADGYHRVTQQPAFVNVHAVVGTAQIAGQLYNAHRDGSALVVTAGMRDTTVYSDDLGLAPSPGFNQTDINEQFTKISWEVRNGASAAVAIRRAYKVASTAPGGPVYVAVTTGAFGARVSERVWPGKNFMIDARPRPAADKVEALARVLIEAKRPVPVFGDEVWKSGAQAEAVQLSEMLGLSAAASSQSFGYANFPTHHPQFVGSAGSVPDADALIHFGTRGLGGGNIPDNPPIDPGVRFVAVGLDTDALGRTQPMDMSIVADVRETLKGVTDAVSSMVTEDRLARIRQERLDIVTPAVAERRATRLEAVRRNLGRSPIHPDQVNYELEQAADDNAIVVMENFTAQHDMLRFGYRPDEKMAIHKGGSLGFGLGAAIGAKIGAPERQVILSIGDGALMYSSSGFWTLARYKVPVLIVVSNNQCYQIVRNAFHRYNGRMAETGHYHGLYLGDPDIDFVKLAESQGVAGQQVTAAGDVAGALRNGIQQTRDGNPYLVEIVVARVGTGAESTWHQEFSVAARAGDTE